MADDDCIQYLGTRTGHATRPLVLPNHPFLTGSQRHMAVTGIALHIENSAESSQRLIFRKAEEAVVHIGRRPGSDSDRGKGDGGKTCMFSCPVVSRNHAKIAFSDSGAAYLIDLDSHHGTHIRKRDETQSNQIQPETPTLLVDGDVITFGKSVGSDKGLVRPVVARVELLYGSQPPLKPLIVPGVAEAQNKSPHSGRYGVYVPASSEGSASSDELASPASHDSDVEEVAGPFPRPPWHESGNDSTSSLRKDEPSYIAPLCSSSLFSQDEYPREYSPVDAQPCSPFGSSVFFNVGFDAYSNDIFEEEDEHSVFSNYSRSTSPMDLSSSPEPSGPPEGQAPLGEPVIIDSASSSPPRNEVQPPPVLDAPVVETRVDKSDKAVEAIVDSGEIEQLKSSLATIKTEVAKLHAHRRKYKQRFNDNIHITGEQFVDLEERTTEVHDLYNALSERLDEGMEANQNAQAQIDALQSQINAVPEEAAPQVEATPSYAEEAKASIQALEQMVTEMTVLRDETRKEMAAELETVRKARDAILQTLAEQTEVQTVSLKRKRPDDEDEDNKVAAATEAAPRASKRVKRIAKVLAQTATAVSVGAVVTWSALAFA
ncbi:hypothetical protein C8J57DRAFT_85205 [Mycena rebaudengoi]|nr:hypothetical protein C8J57DRAFT_85205 [Mycena rebaudengoi]